MTVTDCLMNALVKVHKEDRSEATPPYEQIQRVFQDWIRRPILGTRSVHYLEFEGVTYAEQIDEHRPGAVRVALEKNDGPQPLFSEANLIRCVPQDPSWKGGDSSKPERKPREEQSESQLTPMNLTELERRMLRNLGEVQQTQEPYEGEYDGVTYKDVRSYFDEGDFELNNDIAIPHTLKSLEEKKCLDQVREPGSQAVAAYRLTDEGRRFLNDDWP